MKRFLLFLSLLLFVAACASSVRTSVDQDARVVAFRQFFPEAAYAQSSFSGTGAESMRDVTLQDCGNATLPDNFIRATYVAKAATLVAYVSAGSVLCVASKLNTDAFTITQGDPSLVENGTLLTVNGEAITLAQAQAVYAQLPEATRNETPVATILNQLVDQALLRQAAAGVEVGDDEVEAAAERVWKAAGYASQEELAAALDQQGLSYEDFLSSVKQQLQVQHLLDQQGVTAVDVPEEAVRNFYLDNPNSFLVGEQVRFRQLFISFERSGSPEQAQERLQAALQAIGNGTGFCDAVRRYSDDTDSVERCGEYTAPRGLLVPELEAAIFALQENQSGVVEGPAGYHLVVLLAHQSSTVIPYGRARSQLAGLLKTDLVQQRLGIYLLKLRADAEIVDYTQG